MTLATFKARAEDILFKEENIDGAVKMLSEAAELYAKTKWEQACEEQKEKCAQAYYNNENNLDEDVAIRRAPKPLFNP